MEKDTTYVALDDSKRTLTAGILRPGEREPELREMPERAAAPPPARSSA